MRTRVALFGAIGVVTTGVGLAVLFAPGLVRAAGPADAVLDAIVGAERRFVMLAAALVVGTGLVVIARSSPGPAGSGTGTVATDRFETDANRPETVTVDRRTVTASRVDDRFETAVREGGAQLREVRTQLSTVAAGAHAAATGRSRDTARAAVARGEWTPDPVAAMFLATRGGPEPGVRSRLALWLVPRRERRRRIERTIAAIERLGET